MATRIVQLENEVEQIEAEIKDIKTKFWAENKELRGEIGTLDKKQVRSDEILNHIKSGIDDLKQGFSKYQDKLNQRGWQIWAAIIVAVISGAIGWVISLMKS